MQESWLEKLSEPRITYRDFQILKQIYTLKQELSNTTKSIALNMNITPPAISTAVKRLENLNYVFRVIDAMDRRTIYIELTRRSLDLIVNFNQMYSMFTKTLYKSYSDQQCNTLLQLTSDFKEILQSITDENS